MYVEQSEMREHSLVTELHWQDAVAEFVHESDVVNRVHSTLYWHAPSITTQSGLLQSFEPLHTSSVQTPGTESRSRWQPLVSAHAKGSEIHSQPFTQVLLDSHVHSER